MTIEIRDCFNNEGITIFFGFDSISKLVQGDNDTVHELAVAIHKCEQWRQDVKQIRTKELLTR